MERVSNRSKSVLTVLICLGLVILAVIIMATAAQGAAKFITTPIGYSPPEPAPVLRWRVVPVDMRVVKALRAPRPAPVRLVAPTRLPDPAPASFSGGCYAEPGTPPASVLHRESRGDPKARNPSGAAGCWQFMPGTWAGYGGYSSADQAPVKVQNERAKQVWAGGDGACHWRATTDQC